MHKRESVPPEAYDLHANQRHYDSMDPKSRSAAAHQYEAALRAAAYEYHAAVAAEQALASGTLPSSAVERATLAASRKEPSSRILIASSWNMAWMITRIIADGYLGKEKTEARSIDLLEATNELLEVAVQEYDPLEDPCFTVYVAPRVRDHMHKTLRHWV